MHIYLWLGNSLRNRQVPLQIADGFESPDQFII